MNDEFDLGIEEEVTPAVKKAVKAAKTKEVDPNQKHRIVVSEEEGGLGYVPVGVDGKVYQLQCGVPVEVPLDVVNVLRNAVTTRYRKEVQPDGRENLIPHNVPAVAFQYLGVVE
jgi:hypothetical protein